MDSILSYTYIHKIHLRGTHFQFPIFFPKPIFSLPPSHGFSPTGTGVTPLLFLFSVSIEMEGQEDPDPTNPSAKDPPLCEECKAMGREGGVAVLDAGDSTATFGFAFVSPSLPFLGSAVELLPYREF